jgi:murein DD-endopeptidase MepM/ murein hydrolase activator NlpD
VYGKRQITALVTAAMLTVTAIGPALANELEDRLDNIQRQMQVKQNQAAEAQQRVNSVSGQLRKIQIELDSAQSEYNAIKAKLDSTEQQIKVNTILMEKTEKSLAERSKILNKRMRDIYENGQINYLDVLLGARDFGDFTTRMDLLKRVIKQDTNLIAKVKAERELIAQKRVELEQDKAAIVELEKAAAEKKKLVELRKQEREAVLDKAVSDRDSAERAYRELQETSRQIEQMIRNQSGRSSSSVEATGAMIWPAVGPITSEYGWRIHPIFGTQRYHSGMDIGADYGDPISAADSGVVIYSDWMGGYGKAVIIDHGGGITTLYAHNSELLVVEGQSVRKGQTIARAGSTGYSTGPHCHFEVRVNGSPTNPRDYL